MRVVVVARTRDPRRQAEALRAALGLTLRGAHVEVVLEAPLASPLAERAAATLRAFDHPVGVPLAEALARADRVEVWT